jgi:hypothetical protein
MQIPKAERLREFYRRLREAPDSASLDEALEQLTRILDSVEDEMFGVPRDPANWLRDGRIYPPQRDSARPVPDHPRVTRFRSRKHSTFIGANGAVEIVSSQGLVELRKAGADGRGVWELGGT